MAVLLDLLTGWMYRRFRGLPLYDVDMPHSAGASDALDEAEAGCEVAEPCQACVVMSAAGHDISCLHDPADGWDVPVGEHPELPGMAECDGPDAGRKLSVVPTSPIMDRPAPGDELRAHTPGAGHPACPAVLSIAGEHFACDWPVSDDGSHIGWAHTNATAQAIWSDGDSGRLGTGPDPCCPGCGHELCCPRLTTPDCVLDGDTADRVRAALGATRPAEPPLTDCELIAVRQLLDERFPNQVAAFADERIATQLTKHRK